MRSQISGKFPSREEEIEVHVFPIVSIIEWVIPFIVFANALWNLSHSGRRRER